MYRYTIFILFFALSIKTIIAQKASFSELSVKAGISYNTIIDNNIVQNKQHVIGFKSGITLKYKPFRNTKKIFFINELLINQKGYAQSLDINHKVKLTYLTFPFYVGFQFKDVDLAAGIQYSNLLLTNVKAGSKTYNNNEIALAGLTNYKLSDRIALFFECIYGLNPIIDYYEIDKTGNFKSKIKPFNNFQVSFGTLIKIF